MKMKLTKILILLFLGLFISASAQANELTEKGKEAVMEAYQQFFDLFNKCEKIGLTVNMSIDSPKPKIYLVSVRKGLTH